MNYKQKAHQLLNNMIHQAAKNAKSYKAVVEIPHFELAKELGFADESPMGTLRLVITAEYIDEEQDMYERESGTSAKDTQRN